MSRETHPVTFIHPACGKPAFHRVEVPSPWDPLMASYVEHLDGRPVTTDDLFVCESCGHMFGTGSEFAQMCDPDNWRARE